MRPDRRHTPAAYLPVRRHQLTQRRRRSIAWRPPRRQQKTNWAGVTSLITAFTAVGALIFTALSLNATHDQIAVAQQGQYTDRYSRAIEQLGKQGPDQLQIRLGAIYALERLARDSPRDQSTIIEVLSTFVRTSAPAINDDADTTEEKLLKILTNVDPLMNKYPELSQGFCPIDIGTSPPPDVQAAITVLGRRDITKDNHSVVDLSKTCLRGANLTDANLSGANLTGTDLADTNLVDVNLSNVDLSSAYLGDLKVTDSNLSGADLTSAYFGCTRHTLAVVGDTESYDLHCPTLTNVNLTKAKLIGTQLDGAELEGDFHGIDFSMANLTNVNGYPPVLTNADFRDADFFDANLTGANLSGANLAGAHLVEADLTAANLVRADLTNADLGHAILIETNLTDAHHNSDTVVLKVETDENTKGQWW